MQQTPEVAEPWLNQVQATEAKEKVKEILDEVAVTKDVEDEVGASTAHHTLHWFGTPSEKQMVSKEVLGTTAEYIEVKDQYKKFSEKLKQYVLQ